MSSLVMPRSLLRSICLLSLNSDCQWQLLLSADDLCKQLYPDQAGQNARLDLHPNCLTLSLIVFLKEFFEKVNFEKISADDKKNLKNYPACKDLKHI